MNTCINPECKKQIPDNLTYCSEECLKKAKELKKEKPENNTLQNNKNNDCEIITNTSELFFFRGFGSKIREQNIGVIKKMILAGLTYNEIIKKSRRWFKTQTIDEYYTIANEEIEEEKNGDKKI